MTCAITIAQLKPSRLVAVLSLITAVVTGVLGSSEVASAQASFEVLDTFETNNLPAALIQATDGNFYGTLLFYTSPPCPFGNNGSFFQMTPAGAVTLLHTFNCETDSLEGRRPRAPLIQATDGNFYGTASQGGALERGTVFRMTLGGTMTVLHDFAGDEGAFPNAALLQATDGNFYGTTQTGGAFNAGTVFSMTPDGTTTVLHHFAGLPDDGANPVAALIQGTDGNFYGTTLQGGFANGGIAFQITPDGTFTVLHGFGGSEGYAVWSSLIQATDGNFYGTTNDAVFRMTTDGTPDGTTVTVVHAFAGGPDDGANSEAALLQAADGNFYSTTGQGGPAGYGTVFRLTPDGNFTILHAFTGTVDGSVPHAALIQGTDGAFYGTTYGSSDLGQSVVFRLTLP